jgi:hypothetical protein
MKGPLSHFFILEYTVLLASIFEVLLSFFHLEALIKLAVKIAKVIEDASSLYEDSVFEPAFVQSVAFFHEVDASAMHHKFSSLNF